MSLTNEDLAPVPESKRTWNMWHFAALWVGMAVCITTYTLAASLIDQGMSWWQAILCVALGNVLVLIPMVLNAHAGTKYGIPFPVFARASFGVMGANVPAMLRALVACGWFGIQTWLGGKALHQLGFVMLGHAIPTDAELSANALPLLGITAGQLLGFAVFWAINFYFVIKGTDSIKWLETWAAPFLIVSGLALLLWAYLRAGGFGPMLSQPSKFADTRSFLRVFGPGLTAMVGYWATLSLNIPDFTRYSRSQKDQMIGQAMGLPATMILFAFIGVAVTSATPIIFQVEKPIWDPVELMGRVGGVLISVVAMIALSVATLSTNIAANVVSPANDFSNLSPSRISYKVGGIITAVIGAVILPWKLIETSQGYIYTWLVGYSALLGPVGGIMIADYFLIRKKRLDVDDLYRRGGAYEYSGGVNWIAIVALAIGAAVSLPGFLCISVPSWKVALDARDLLLAADPSLATARDTVLGVFRTIYTYAWFVGFGLAAGLYMGGMALTGKARHSFPTEPA